MAPRIRTIKPEFFRSESNSQMPLRTRLTYIGLWTECDDHGRMRDNARLIKGAIWPLDDVSPKEIEIDLNTLADRGKIIRYEVGGRRYLAVTNWDDHQAAAYRRGEPRHPGPDEGVVQESASRTMKSADRTASRAGTGNREQGTVTPSSAAADGARIDELDEPATISPAHREPNTPADSGDALVSPNTPADGGPDSQPNTPADRGAKSSNNRRFDEFWAIYPRKVGKKAARRKWDVAVKDADPDVIIAGAKRYAEHVRTTRTEERFIAHPETWLNQGRWDDDLATQRTSGDVSPLWRGADL